jgi:hypothetical protein
MQCLASLTSWLSEGVVHMPPCNFVLLDEVNCPATKLIVKLQPYRPPPHQQPQDFMVSTLNRAIVIEESYPPGPAVDQPTPENL